MYLIAFRTHNGKWSWGYVVEKPERNFDLEATAFQFPRSRERRTDASTVLEAKHTKTNKTK